METKKKDIKEDFTDAEIQELADWLENMSVGEIMLLKQAYERAKQLNQLIAPGEGSYYVH